MDPTLALAMGGDTSRAIRLSRGVAQQEVAARERFNSGEKAMYERNHYYQGLTDQFNKNPKSPQMRSPYNEMKKMEDKKIEAAGKSRYHGI